MATFYFHLVSYSYHTLAVCFWNNPYILYLAAVAEGTIRLMNGTSASSGRVEIYNAGEWGTVCDDSFGFDEAEFICRAMGFE